METRASKNDDYPQNIQRSFFKNNIMFESSTHKMFEKRGKKSTSQIKIS